MISNQAQVYTMQATPRSCNVCETLASGDACVTQIQLTRGPNRLHTQPGLVPWGA